MTSVAPTTRARLSDPAAGERELLRRRLRSSLLTLAISLAFLIAFPVAAWSAPEQQVDSLIQVALYLGGLSLLPFAVMTLTSFLRIVVVLSFLRSGLGAQNVPPNIVIIALALFLSLFVMNPTIQKINTNAVQPLLANRITSDVAFNRAKGPLKEFMVRQIAGKGSKEEIATFYRLALKQDAVPCKDTDINARTGVTNNCLITQEQFDALARDDAEVAVSALPLHVIIPAFIVSELKKAFVMGFAVLLPFLVIDMVISNILLSLGMFMLPPVVISLPFKILLFVLAGGWTMVVEFIVQGFKYA